MMKQEKFSDDNSILRFLAEKKLTRKIAPAARDRGRTLPQISICGNEAFP